jgi:tRNA modification GTPase
VLARGIEIVIAGPPNVGKSTLLNRLLRDDRAIVSDRAGTTRDVIRGEIHLAGIPVNVADTAGLNETPDPVEQQGIARAYTAIGSADIVLLVNDQPQVSERLLSDVMQRIKPGALLIKVINKRDLFEDQISRILERCGDCAYAVSAFTGVGIAELEAAIVASLGLADTEEGEFLARERHIEALRGAREAIRSAREQAVTRPFLGELIAEELRLAQRLLEGLVGKVDAEDLLGAIFSRFCVGK